MSFHDLIKNKARGKSGPLFEFSVRQDVRLGDVRVQKGESHAGKIVERKWYNNNKHIFPASRWEIYDPKVDRSGPYTVKDTGLVPGPSGMTVKDAIADASRLKNVR